MSRLKLVFLGSQRSQSMTMKSQFYFNVCFPPTSLYTTFRLEVLSRSFISRLSSARKFWLICASGRYFFFFDFPYSIYNNEGKMGIFTRLRFPIFLISFFLFWWKRVVETNSEYLYFFFCSKGPYRLFSGSINNLHRSRYPATTIPFHSLKTRVLLLGASDCLHFSLSRSIARVQTIYFPPACRTRPACYNFLFFWF